VEILLTDQGSWGLALSTKAQKRYLELIGKECYFYQWNQYAFDDKGVDEYILIPDKPENDKYCEIAVTKNLGDITNCIPDDAYFCSSNLKRNDPILIRVIKELGPEAENDYSKFRIIEIPDDVKEWYISKDEIGCEAIHEKHRSWR
jgi:hypothetical protein